MFPNLTIIELASVLAGPSVGMFFAELGARVIKVENLATDGDVTRSWKLPSESKDNDISAYFSSINWGKESIALNLKSEEGQKIVHQLIQKADIVLCSFMPGKAEKLGVDADTLLKENPRLIVAEINGYGRDEARPAYDAIIQAEAGFTFMNGNPDQPVKMAVALMDILAAHQLKEAVLLAYIQLLKTGKGGRVSTSLIESGIASLANQATNWLVANQIPRPKGSDHPNIVPYGTIFYTKDEKPIVLAVGNDKQFQSLCNILNMDLNPEFATNTQRVTNREKVNDLLRNRIRLWDRTPLLQELRYQNIPAGAVNNMPEVFETPQAQNMILEQNSLSGVRTIAAKMDDFKPSELNQPPAYNQHGKQILQELGYSEEMILELIQNEVIAPLT